MDTTGAGSLSEQPLISIVIPSRNEEQDIAATLDACVALSYPRREVIVVDDSSDATPRIVAGYADRGVRLIQREQNLDGCCGARNLGMREAKGEILVLVNADDRPEPDFLNRILEHYRAGVDYLVVSSQVLHPTTLWERVVVADRQDMKRRRQEPNWSEGFSCRSTAAAAVGYIPGRFPVAFCRDNAFSALLEQRFKKRYDPTIVMPHVAPNSFGEFWRNRVWRGSFSAPHQFYLQGKSLSWVVVRELLRAGSLMMRDLLILPPLVRSFHLARGLEGLQRMPEMLLSTLVRDGATVVGGMVGLGRVLRTELRLAGE